MFMAATPKKLGEEK